MTHRELNQENSENGLESGQEKRKMFFVNGTLIAQQTELGNSSAEIGSKEIKEGRSSLQKNHKLSVNMQY